MKNLWHFAMIFGAIFQSTPISAEPIIFETDEGVRVVRWIDLFGSVSVEVITQNSGQMINCIALDTGGEPIASSVGFSGAMLFNELKVADVADVKCRLN